MGGFELMIAGALAGKLLSSVGQKDAIADQAKNEMQELKRQQEEENKRAAAEKSDRAMQADKQAAQALAAMEAIGGFGSVNDDRLQMEIAGTAGLDLARIEGGRNARNAALRAAQKATRNAARNKMQAINSQFLQDAVSGGNTIADFNLTGSQQSTGVTNAGNS